MVSGAGPYGNHGHHRYMVNNGNFLLAANQSASEAFADYRTARKPFANILVGLSVAMTRAIICALNEARITLACRCVFQG